jgi:hypothetical protein
MGQAQGRNRSATSRNQVQETQFFAIGLQLGCNLAFEDF